MIDPFLLYALVSHPHFKTDWLNNEDTKDRALSFFKQSCLGMFERQNISESKFQRVMMIHIIFSTGPKPNQNYLFL